MRPVAGTKRYTVAIEPRYCKACGICVKFCPAKILELRYQVLRVTDQDRCLGCRACELRCPDFALEVKER